jgi:osmotically-inducible protein OsmY
MLESTEAVAAATVMLEPGDTLNHGAYRIVKELGAGGFGVVYLAEEVALRRSVAVKTILPEVAARDRNAAEGFLNEARMNAGLDHPGIIHIHYVGQESVRGRVVHYIVMEYVQSGDLETVLSLETVDLGQRFRWMRQIAEGLAHAHQQGIIHRDLKLRNILLSRNRNVKIGDFGLAKAVGTETKTIMKGLGTPGYVSPEQIQGRTTDCRSDVYSLGVMYYQMLTGRLPYDAPEASDSTAKVMAICYQHVNAPVPSARSLSPAVPAALDQLVRRMMAKSPADRPANAAEVAQSLERVALVEPEESGGPRWSAWAAVAGAVLVLGAAIFFMVPKVVPKFFGDPAKGVDGRNVQPPVKPIDDGKRLDGQVDVRQIERLVRQKLWESGLVKLTADVGNDQFVMLTGSAQSQEEKDRAVRIAGSVGGVKGVRERIDLAALLPDSDQLQRLVIDKLAEKGFNLRVDVSPERIATLTGHVMNAEQKDQAVRLARAVPGVKSVRENIAIAAPPPGPTDLERRVSATLRDNGLNLRVNASADGVVVLIGSVTSAEQKVQAVRLARAVPGVKAVDDRTAIADVAPHAIELRVGQSLRENGLSNLKVVVSPARIVTLTGVVKTNVDRDRAIKLAWVPGVVRVEPRINCQHGPGCWSE